MFLWLTVLVGEVTPSFALNLAPQSGEVTQLPADPSGPAQGAGVHPLASTAKPATPVSNTGSDKPTNAAALGDSTRTPQQPNSEDSHGPRTENVASAHDRIEISYRDGLLTLDAHNATLADVLKLISQKTGAEIEVPSGSGRERIVEHTGPGPVNDMLVHLLIGSPFNFVIVNSAERPQEVARVVLSLQSGAAAPPPPDQVTGASDSSPLWTPPADASAPEVLPAHLDGSLTLPDDAATMSPEARSEFMRKKFDELREKAQQQYPQ